MPRIFPVTRFVQNRKELYFGIIRQDQLLEGRDVARWMDARGYQRLVNKKKVSRIASFIIEKEGILPASIILSIRDPEARFVSTNGDSGELIVPDNATIYIVDGQHRIFGVQNAATWEKGLRNFGLPAVFLCPANWETNVEAELEEGKQFLTVNKTQAAVKKDLLDSFLLPLNRAVERSGPSALNGLPNEIIKEMTPRRLALNITMTLTRLSAWNGKIVLSNESKGPNSVIGQTTFVDSLVPLMKNKSYASRLPGDIARDLNYYWNAILNIYPEARESPNDYYLQKRLGIFVFNYLFYTVDGDVVEKSEESYRRVLRRKGKMRTSRFWSKGGQASLKGTSYGAVTEVMWKLWPHPRRRIQK